MNQHRSDCPLTYCLDLLGDKWSLLILRDILFHDKCYYHEFMNSKEQISTNILADRLQKLEYHNLVTRKEDKDHGRRKIYEPTRKALELLPMLYEYIKWGIKYSDNTDLPNNFLKLLKGNKDTFVSTFKK